LPELPARPSRSGRSSGFEGSRRSSGFEYSRRSSGFEYSPAPVIERIGELERSGQVWRLTASEVRRLLGLDSASFHQRLYAAEKAGDRLVGLSSAAGSFTQENVGELVSLLELFCGPGVERELERAGIFFSHPEQLELMSSFLGAAGESLAAHRLEESEFSAMLAAFRSFERSRQVYREQYFPLRDLEEEAVRRFCSVRSFRMPELARANARWLLDFFFRKHVLDVETLFAPLHERLREQAVREGYVEPPPREEARGGRGSAASTPAAHARRLLGLEEGRLDLARLKSRYKLLMKIYHPDLNPQGLRRCQEINAAYTLLHAALSSR
jgi:hypothetical protein